MRYTVTRRCTLEYQSERRAYPDLRLNEKQRAVIEKDYAMSDGVLRIATNASLVRYVLDTYNIDIYVQKSNPQGQQIVLGNRNELVQFIS